MKKTVGLGLILASFLFATPVEFVNTLETAQYESLAQNKSILVMLTQEGCPTCEYMEEVAFKEPFLASYLMSHFIVLKLDVNRDTLPQNLKAYGTPTFYILNPQGEKIGRQIAGGGTASEFLKLLQSYKTKN